MRSAEGLGVEAEAFGDLDRALDRISGLDVDRLEPADLGECLRRLRAHVDKAELLGARMVAAFERVDGHVGTGAADTIDFLSRECKLSPESAMDRVILGRQLNTLPTTVGLLAEGKLSYEQAAVMSRSAAKVRPEDAGTVEARLLESGAAGMNPGRLRQHAASVVAAVDDEVLRRDAARARERREFRIGPTVDGSASVSGNLTSEGAAYLRAGLGPFMCPAGAQDSRTAGQRRHDALMQLAKQAVLGAGNRGHAHQPDAGGTDTEPGGTGSGHARRPQLVVVAPLSAMMGQDGPPALLQGLVPISQEELDVLVCEADLRVVLKDSAGNIAFAGKRARTFSAAKRNAMLATNPTCAFEGCNLPAIDATMHHVDEYADGGLTTVETGGPTCWVHHPMIHVEGWALVASGDGGFRTLPPGDPDNPKAQTSGEEYRRRRREAIFKRMAARRAKPRRKAAAGAAAERAGPQP